ncbi:MAG: YvcK family protein [Erysipelotrichaceae bacterium]|nr:YvcK family protein [Erysipelotrichaceae bacterium]
MKKVVVIGGGTGLSSMMEGLKALKDIELTAIITVADDGGSTGRIRDVYNIPAMGDIRHVLTAMSSEENETLFQKLMEFRFAGQEDIGGHQLGNLIFLALTEITGSFMGAVQAISKVLKVRGTILPSTLDNAVLYALMEDGTLVRGEKNIPNMTNSISKVFYQQNIRPYQAAIEAIEQADLIVYGIGSLYTSILPNLIIKEISNAIYNSPAPKVYFCNTMTQPGETDGYSMEDHVRAIETHTFKNAVDAVVINNKRLPKEVEDRYKQASSYPVTIRDESHPYRIYSRPLTSVDPTGRVRHEPAAVREAVAEVIKDLVK